MKEVLVGQLIPHGYVDIDDVVRSIIAAKRSVHTRRAYTADWQRWERFAAALGASLENPTLSDATRFRDTLLASILPQSTRRTLAALTAIYTKLLYGRVATSNPFNVHVLAWPPPSEAIHTKAVPQHVAEAMIATAQNEGSKLGLRDAALLRLLYDAGIRRESAIRLRRDAITNHRTGWVARLIVKGGKEVETAIIPETIQAIQKWLAVAPPSEFVFPGRDPTKPLHANMVNRIVTQRAEAAGAPWVHPHAFRAAFVTEAFDAGLSAYEVQSAVHHAQPTTTQRYDRGRRGLGVAVEVAKRRRTK